MGKVTIDPKEIRRLCKKEEEKYQFPKFTRENAKELGELLSEAGLDYEKPIAVEIRLNGLSVYRFFPEGTNRNNELWLDAKAKTVDMFEMSSLHLWAELECTGETLADRRVNELEYAGFGGGFPIRLYNNGVIGTICTSGLDHTDDHRVIIEALELFKERKKI